MPTLRNRQTPSLRRHRTLVIAGSYEGGLHGWTFDNDNYELKFSFAAHQGCIRCVATNSHVEDAQPLC